jgi:formiminotetrahydrofolate cyclodeaminase
MNVRINLLEMSDDPDAKKMLERADEAVRETRRRAAEVEAEVWSLLGGEVSDL